jgi:hypothetical protein
MRYDQYQPFYDDQQWILKEGKPSDGIHRIIPKSVSTWSQRLVI